MRTSHNTTVRKRVVTTILGIAVLLGIIGPLASATPTVDIVQSWGTTAGTTTGGSVNNGAASPYYVWVNSNDTAYADGSQANVTFVSVIRNARPTAVPAECTGSGSGITQQTPTSAESGTVKTRYQLTCNVGTMKFGTAKRVSVALTTDGFNAVPLTVETIVKGSNKAAPTLTRQIVATTGGDLRMDYTHTSKTIGDTGRTQVLVPFAISIPSNGEGLSPSASFVLTLGNMTMPTGKGVANTLRPKGGNACSLGGVTAQAGWPVPWGSDKITCAATPYGTGGNQWTITITNMNTEVGRVTKDNTGANLPAGRTYLTSASIVLENYANLFPDNAANGSVFQFFARADSPVLRTAKGVAVADNPTTNNREEITFILGGSRASAWARRMSNLSMDGAKAPGREWDAKARVTVGEKWTAYAFDEDANQDMSVCLAIPSGEVLSRNYVFFNSPTGANTTVKALYSSIGDASAYAGAQCPNDSYAWVNLTTAPQTHNGLNDVLADIPMIGASNSDATKNSWALGHLRWLGTPGVKNGTMPNFIKIDYKKANITASSNPYPTNGNAAFLAAPAVITAPADSDGRIWEFGSSKRGADATYYTSASAGTTTNLGSGNPSSTNGLRDVLIRTAFKVSVTKSGSPASLRVNDVATFTIKIPLDGNAGSTTGRLVDVVDTLPAGLTYVAGSARVNGAAVNPTISGQNLTFDNVRIAENATGTITLQAKATSTGVKKNSVTVTKDGSTDVTAQGERATASASVTVTDVGETFITHNPRTASTTTNTANGWKLTIKNDDRQVQPVIDTISILPWNGDGRGTKFSGKYSVTSIGVNPTASIAFTTYYSTLPPNRLSDDPEHVGTTGGTYTNGGLGTPAASAWSTTVPADRSTITAVRVVARNVPIGVTELIDINWTPTGNAGGDVYVNRAASKATYTELIMLNDARVTITAPNAPPQPDLIIDKVLNPDQVISAGSRLYWTVTVRNKGVGAAPQFTVTDTPLDNGGSVGTPVIWSGQSTGTVSGAVWTIPSLAAGATATAQVSTTVATKTDFDLEKPVKNFVKLSTASCTPSNVQVNDTVDEDTDGCDFDEVYDMSILKVDKKVDSYSTLTDGSRVEYTITVRNDGGSGAASVSVVDVPVKELTNIQFSNPSVGTFNNAAGTWSIGTMDAGAEETIKVTATVKWDPADGNMGRIPLHNATYVQNPLHPRDVPVKDPNWDGGEGDYYMSCNANEPYEANPDDEATGDETAVGDVVNDDDQCDYVSVEVDYNLKIDKQASNPDTAPYPGERVEFDLVVMNDGNSWSGNARVWDAGGAYLEDVIISDPSAGDVDPARPDRWEIGPMEPGERATAHVSARVKAGMPASGVTNTARVWDDFLLRDKDPALNPGATCTANEDVEDDEDWCDIVQLDAISNVRVDKLADAATDLSPGKQVTFLVTALNDGPRAARDVVVTDTQMAGLTNVVFSSPQAGTVSGNRWTVGTLAPNTPVTARVTATIAAGADTTSGLRNMVTISSYTQPKTPPAAVTGCSANGVVNDDQDQCDWVEIKESPVLRVDKAIGTKPALVAGNQVTFQITALNSGPTTASQVVVTDTQLVGFTNVVFSAPQVGTVSGNTWSIPVLEVGAPKVATVTATIAANPDVVAGLRNGVTISNPVKPRTPMVNTASPCVVNTGAVATDTDQCDWVSVTEVSKLRINKDHLGGTPEPGSTVTWRIQVTNSGPDIATNVTVVEPAGQTGMETATYSGQSKGTFSGNTWNVGTLAVGEVATVTASTKVRDGVTHGQALVNEARVSAPSSPFVNTGTCQPNTTLAADTDQCDNAQVAVVLKGDVQVTVLFDPTGTQGDCTKAGNTCVPVSAIDTRADDWDAGGQVGGTTNAQGQWLSPKYPPNETVFTAILVPEWARLTSTTIDGGQYFMDVGIADRWAGREFDLPPGTTTQYRFVITRDAAYVPPATNPDSPQFESGLDAA